MAEMVSDNDVQAVKPPPKRRRILEPSEIVPVPVYSSKVSSSLNLKPMAAIFPPRDGSDKDTNDSLWAEFPSQLKTASVVSISDSEDESEAERCDLGDKRAEDTRCPSPPPESPVQKQSRRVAKKISELNRKLQAVSSTISPEHDRRRSRRCRNPRLAPEEEDDDNDVVIVSPDSTPLYADLVREIPLKIRCRADVYKIPVLSTTPLSHVVTQLSVILNVPPPRLQLLNKEVELPTESTVRELGLGIADIVECVVMAAEATDSGGVITVRLQGKDRASSQDFSVSRDAPLSSVFSQYVSAMAAGAQKRVRFLFDGARLTGSQTPAQLDMEDGDIIEAWT